MAGRPQERATNKALAVLEYMNAFFDKHGYQPTRRELATHFETSTSVIDYRLQMLASWDLIVITWGEARAIKIIKPERRKITVWLCGYPDCTYYSSVGSMRCSEHVDYEPIKRNFEENEK